MVAKIVPMTPGRLGVDLLGFTLLMVGSVVGAGVMVQNSQVLLAVASVVFSFSYAARQFERFGRIRHHRLLVDQMFPMSFRNTWPHAIGHFVRAGIACYPSSTYLPGMAWPFVISLVLFGGAALQQMFSYPQVGQLVDAHEKYLRTKSLAKLTANIKQERDRR